MRSRECSGREHGGEEYGVGVRVAFQRIFPDLETGVKAQGLLQELCFKVALREEDLMRHKKQ